MKTQKRLAASLLKCGVNRIRIDSKDEDAMMAMTRGDVKRAIVRGSIYAIPMKGTSRVRAKAKAIARKKGRSRGHGTWKGHKTSRTPKKRAWITKIRAIRKKLREMKAKGMEKGQYRKFYRLAKAGIFKNKAHVESAAGGK